MCDLPTFEPHIRVIEQWRDYFWRCYLNALQYKQTRQIGRYKLMADTTHKLIINISALSSPKPLDDDFPGFSGLQYGQYPDDMNIPVMD